nr:transposase [Rhizobium leguminosarum]
MCSPFRRLRSSRAAKSPISPSAQSRRRFFRTGFRTLPEALSLWTARRRTSRGGQPKYSDLAITLCLTLRVVYGLALRQTQGLMRSVAALMGFDIAVPDFSTLSRRSKGLALPSTKSEPQHQVRSIWLSTAPA